MSRNIKNEEVCALAREIALRTGQTQTGAIASALEALFSAYSPCRRGGSPSAHRRNSSTHPRRPDRAGSRRDPASRR
ncbi:type II toxin-antitoxin system VapB family antitoxin [Nostocoides vanveenii]|uniref:type II toxin-antitoxin system VapB family antitoxin n=1 Tax=Nostocoides vanveenii TaxID=330835 RepID=UPI003CD0536D